MPESTPSSSNWLVLAVRGPAAYGTFRPIADIRVIAHDWAMGSVKRISIVLGSVGWIAPLCASFWATHDFLRNVVWMRANFGKEYPFPWHPFELADEAFYLSMAWLAVVIVGWAIHLTREP